MSLLDSLKKVLQGEEEDKFAFNRNKKIMASTTMDSPEEMKQTEIGL